MEIGVYGIGRFGHLWAAMLAKQAALRGDRVLVANRSSFKAPLGTTPVDLKRVAQSNALFLCVAISALEEVLTQIAPHLSPTSLLVDTCSIKRYPEQLMKRIAPSTIEILGMHPMFGPDSIQEGEDQTVVICPIRSSASTVAQWGAILSGMGCRIVQMSSEQHDRKVAYIQGFTHLIGRIAQQMELKESEITTLGYRKILALMQQTCNDSEQLFVDLQRFNPHTPEMLQLFQNAVEEISRKIAKDNA